MAGLAGDCHTLYSALRSNEAHPLSASTGSSTRMDRPNPSHTIMHLAGA